MLARMQADSRIGQALWPALLLAVIAFVVLDFVQHPPWVSASDAAGPPAARWTLYLAQTEAEGESAEVVRATADSLLLYGRPGATAMLPGGSSQAIGSFFAHRRPAGRVLAISGETLADLVQERESSLFGDDPLRAARAQRLLERATPVGVLSEEELGIAVSPSSNVHNAAQLLAQLRDAGASHVFAIPNEGFEQDSLAALVRDGGVQGVVPYRVFPSAQDALLALTAGEADVILAPRAAIAAQARAHRLRELAWPTALAGPAPRSWVELLAPSWESAASVHALRRQLHALSANATWRRLIGLQAHLQPLSGSGLASFLPAQAARTELLQRTALRIERDPSSPAV